MSEEKKIHELNDEELLKVTGGSHVKNGKTYSDLTYAQLGFSEAIAPPQKPEYRPLIVFGMNTCRLSSVSCAGCGRGDPNFLCYYCMNRSEQHDDV